MSDAVLNSSAYFRLALCARLALPQGSSDKAFGPVEYSKLERALTSAGVSDPADLMGRVPEELAEMLSVPRSDAERIARLLARSGQIAIEVERLSARGIWVLTRGDAGYPQRWHALLGDRAPVVVYGAGDRRLLGMSGVAVVGSRNVSEDGAQFARRVGEVCAQAGVAVISGGARGVDRQTMTGALESGGHAIGILADDLTRVTREPELRQWLEDNRIVLVKDYHASAPFSVGLAMARNKLIYCLAKAAIVVASEESGGTWEGARENLKERWTPLFVRADEPLPPGNAALLRQEAHPLHAGDLTPEFLAAAYRTEPPPLPDAHSAQSSFTFE